MNSFQLSFSRLKDYCEREGFRGWDPYDGLTSRLFRALPLLPRQRLARLAWIQLFKRSPLNLRRLAAVPKSYNPKGLALFLQGYCHLYRLEPSAESEEKIHFLAGQILALQSPGYSGACWGYPFDWQARAFFQPAGTPTVVATSFTADALFEAAALFGVKAWQDTAVSSARFVQHDLNRSYDDAGHFSFSYSPLDHTQVFNASLLGARLLARCAALTGNSDWKEDAARAVQYVCERQQGDGAWSYGTLPFHQWIDNFHTGFNLECIHEYGVYTGDERFRLHVDRGFDYYVNTFFEKNGAARYYNNRLYPVDIHAPAQLIATLVRLGRFDQNRELADRVLNWTITHMQDPKGYFYYQRKKSFSAHIPYMRWAQAWMFYAMSLYFSATQQVPTHDRTRTAARHTGQ